MAEKCELRSKKVKAFWYYKCKKNDECTEQCVLYLKIKEKDGGGEEIIEVGCDCIKIAKDDWKKKNHPDPRSCKVMITERRDENKKEKTFKIYVRCENEDCSKECIVWIKYEDPDKHAGPYEDFGCECNEWDKL